MLIHRKIGVLCLLAGAGGMLGACKDRPKPAGGGQAAESHPDPSRRRASPNRRASPERRPGPGRQPAQAATGASIRAALKAARTDDAHYRALDRFVRGWPATRSALPAVLELLRTKSGIRGGVALSIARLGAPLAPALVAMVRRDPTDDDTLLAAGVLAYHLVSPHGLTVRSAAEREKTRAALAPIQEPLWKKFQADRRPDYEIYQGVAAGAEATLERLRPPFPKGGLTRVAMVLYLILTADPEESLLEAKRRAKWRAKLAPLAGPFARALAGAQGYGRGNGESPDSLVLGLSVLGTAGAAAVANEPGLQAPAQCPRVLQVLLAVAEQGGATAAAPARPALQRCLPHAGDAGLAQRGRALLRAVKKGNK